MKRFISAVAVLLFITTAAPLFAAQRSLVDDVIRMSKAGVGEDSIIAFIQNTKGPIEVTADDIIAMTEAGLSKPLIKAVIDESAARSSHRGEAVARGETASRGEAASAPPPRVYVSPYYYDPYYYYDPFWYAPRLYLNFGFGPFYGGHGGFRGGFRHGRH